MEETDSSHCIAWASIGPEGAVMRRLIPLALPSIRFNCSICSGRPKTVTIANQTFLKNPQLRLPWIWRKAAVAAVPQAKKFDPTGLVNVRKKTPPNQETHLWSNGLTIQACCTEKRHTQFYHTVLYHIYRWSGLRSKLAMAIKYLWI